MKHPNKLYYHVDFSKTNIGHFFLKVVVKHPHKLSYHVAFRRLHGLRVLRHVHDPEQKISALIDQFYIGERAVGKTIGGHQEDGTLAEKTKAPKA